MTGDLFSSEKHWLKHHSPRDVVYRITLKCDKCGRSVLDAKGKAICPYRNCSYSVCACGRNTAVGAADQDRMQEWFGCPCGSGFIGHYTYAEQRRPPAPAKKRGVR